MACERISALPILQRPPSWALVTRIRSDVCNRNGTPWGRRWNTHLQHRIVRELHQQPVDAGHEASQGWSHHHHLWHIGAHDVIVRGHRSRGLHCGSCAPQHLDVPQQVVHARTRGGSGGLFGSTPRPLHIDEVGVQSKPLPAGMDDENNCKMFHASPGPCACTIRCKCLEAKS
jgi:hypothetical protein